VCFTLDYHEDGHGLAQVLLYALGASVESFCKILDCVCVVIKPEFVLIDLFQADGTSWCFRRPGHNGSHSAENAGQVSHLVSAM
jgi:hypothetical protein